MTTRVLDTRLIRGFRIKATGDHRVVHMLSIILCFYQDLLRNLFMMQHCSPDFNQYPIQSLNSDALSRTLRSCETALDTNHGHTGTDSCAATYAHFHYHIVAFSSLHECHQYLSTTTSSASCEVEVHKTSCHSCFPQQIATV